MLICGANDVIGVGQLMYTAVAIFRCWYCQVLPGTGAAGTGLPVLVLLVCVSASSWCCRCTRLYY
eukprot:SAG31_NODE_2893_length_4940_cov_237.861805_2_plen_65_part_00